jgi:hypothetical protein
MLDFSLAKASVFCQSSYKLFTAQRMGRPYTSLAAKSFAQQLTF